MCKALFPEYDYFRIYNNNIEGLTQQLLDFENRDWFDNHNEENKWSLENYISWEFSIPWFEFCVTQLQVKLYHELSKNIKLGIDTWNYNLIGKIYFYCHAGDGTIGHPIDYLYKQFKKLKS